MKRFVRATFLLWGVVAGCMGELRALPPSTDPDCSLLRRAVRTDCIERAGKDWSKWVTTHKLYVNRFPYDGHHTHLTFSPDNRFALWRSEGKFMVVGLRGNSYRCEWEDDSDEMGPLVWMPDSRHWFFLQYSQATKRTSIEIHDLQEPEGKKTFVLPSEMDDVDLVTAQGIALGHDYTCSQGQFPGNVRQIKVFAARLLPRPRLLHRYQVRVPTGKRFCGVDISPMGDRLAWTFTEPSHFAGKRRRSVWISSLDGGVWREVGTLPLGSNEEDMSVVAHWMPGGKDLTVHWKDKCWRVLGR